MTTQRHALVTVNVHGLGPEERETPPESLFGRFGHGRYTYNVGLQRVLDFLRGNGIRGTFFWPVVEARRCPDLLRACMADGHEIASHGLAFEDISKLGDQEADLLKQAKQQLEDLCGQAVHGFRAPEGLVSLDTVRILQDLGYVYDSSYIDDDAPYSLVSDNAARMVELPWSEGLSDITHFRRRFTQGRAALALRAEFQGLIEAEGYACLSLHPRGDIGSGRAARLEMLQGLIADIRASGASFTRAIDLARTCLVDGTVQWQGRTRAIASWA
ncbi:MULTISPECIES: polysaccharide deacetylase family protein [unclassified Achromobacter]|uniref:polysaccharide deacetylase family protein n=1 Tax=unclassified Achromobacter TaxID=2626865 RepID=UPI000B517638|nr:MULTISPECIES: polysaccharide deacetylase family protein [unclassified Achromobacter]OWT76886.1 polysaccharide deacetylase [Achromobacter sp. HZ28]OWT77766.1 polysaccharide deacetylase [Achromobacter sp. HZ34]